MNANHSAPLVVRLTNGIAIKFHNNFMSRKVYSAVRDEDATLFEAEWQAELKAREHGMNPRDYHVAPLSQNSETETKH